MRSGLTRLTRYSLAQSHLHRSLRTLPRIMSSSINTSSVSEGRKLDIRENIRSVQEKIQLAIQSRNVNDKINHEKSVCLVAVSKLKPPSDILVAYEFGQRHFGENYIQELEEKSKVLPSDIQWHFIGALQTNKCKILGAIPNLFAVETVDTVKKATALENARASIDGAIPLNVFIQINTSGEDTKSGISLGNNINDGQGSSQAPHDLLELAKYIKQECNNLRLAGLMTIGSFEQSNSSDTENIDFRRLFESRTHLATALDIVETELELSMGMSADYEAAIQVGSSNVRVGSTIFGERPSKQEASQIQKAQINQ